MNKYIVVIERAGKTEMIVLRADDYDASVRNRKIRWGTGRKWEVVRVLDYEAYQNQTDSKPFKK